MKKNYFYAQSIAVCVAILLTNTVIISGILIQPMTFDTSLLTADGQFTEKSLPKFLAQAFNQKKLTDPSFSKEACIKAKDIAKKGGYNTEQLFLITTTCSTNPASLYIVKEAKDGVGEAEKLKQVANTTKFKDIIAPKVKKGLPTLSLPLAYFSYPDKQTTHYISAMPSAKGKAMSDLAVQYQKNKTPQNEELLKRAFFILGNETANFHNLFRKSSSKQLLGTVVAHGDFHLLNIFFDEIAGHTTFIDNETIALYLKQPVSPAKDICKPFYMPFNSTYDDFLETIKGINLKTWYEITLKNFVLGYAQAFPQNQQVQVLKELQTMFNKFELKDWVNFYDLEKVRKQYINPIFDELIKNATPKKK